MQNWKLLKGLLLLTMITVLAACGNGNGDNDSGKIKLVAAHNQTDEENPYQDGLVKFKEVVEEESDGDIEVETHAGTIGTEESELVEKLKTGAADVVLVSPGFMTETGIEEIDLFAVPYLFDDYDHWEEVVDGEVGDKTAEIINEESNNDFKLLGYWSAGVRHYYGKKPLESIDDLKGVSIRTQTSGVVADYWKETGASPTDVDWGELYQALEQGVVDASENSYPYFVQQGHHTTKNGEYVTETAHDYTTRFLLTNGEQFDSFSEDQQEIILDAAEKSVETERESLYEQEDEYKEKAIDDGAEVNEIDRDPFIDLAEPLQDKTAEDTGTEELLQKIREMK